MPYYAQITENGVCTSVSELRDETDAPNMIALTSLDRTLLGRLWSGAAWGDAPAQPPGVPASVTRRQARQALLLAGLLDKVEPAIAAIPDPVQRGMAAIEWADSQAFERDRPLLIALASALGLDDDALDNLFIQAAKL